MNVYTGIPAAEGIACALAVVVKEIIPETVTVSLDEAVDLLIKIISGNDERLKQQVEYQLKAVILRNVCFSVMYNAVRYPYYGKQQYSITDIGSEDCKILEEIYDGLKNYLKQLSIML